MGRREKPIDPGAGPVQRFAFELRKLRVEADSPTYREMAGKAGYSTAALARAAAGETLPSLPLALAYVTACGGDPQEWERRWHAVRDEEAAQPRDPDEEPAEPPYRGLARFEPGDHARFFGRTRLTDDLAGLTRDHRCVLVVGPSGSGKSSLLRAGLIPHLQQTEAPARRPAAIRVLTPGPRPVREHRERFAPADGPGDTWLVVDQFEEVFTLCQDPAERREFIGLLLSARDPGSRLRVVAGVRADFYAHCLQHEGLAAVVREASLPVGPMRPEELRAVIVKPAAAAGLIVERTLTDRLIEEAGEEPGGLPLLSHTLLETWRRRRGRTLTLDGYEASGGIHGAIAQTAEAVYAAEPPARQALMHAIFLRLTALGDGFEDTRRPVPRTELVGLTGRGRGDAPPADTDDDAVNTLLHRLAAARLLVLTDGTVEVAHEAVIRAWPRLRHWLDDDRDALRTHHRLTAAARTWQELHRDRAALYRGSQLDAARTWAEEHGHTLNSVEREFLHQADLAGRRRARRARSVTTALAFLLVLTLVAAVTAYRQRDEAETARQQAQSRQLAIQSDTLLDSHPDLASLLAVQAYRTHPTAEATNSLYKAADLPLRHRLTTTRGEPGDDDTGVAVALRPDGHALATGSEDGTVRVWDPATGHLLATLTGHRGKVASLAFRPDGRTLLIATDEGTVWLGDTRTGRVRATPVRHQDQGAPVLSPDGRTVASADAQDTVRLYDIATGRVRATLPGSHAAKAFSPDGKTLVTSALDNSVRLWDTATARAGTTLANHGEEMASLAFSRDGRALATGGADGGVRLWDRATGRLRGTATGRFDTGAVLALAFSPDGRAVAAGGWGAVRVWDTATGGVRATLTGHEGSVGSVAFSPDGRTLVTGGDGTARLWDTGTGATLTGHRDLVNAVVFSPDGRTLATGSADGTVRLWDVPARRLRTVLTGRTSQDLLVFGRDGRTLTTVDDDLTVRVWDTGSGHVRSTRTAPEHASSDALALSPDTHTLVARRGLSVRLWNHRTGHTRVTRTSLEDRVGSAVFGPDGRTLATTAGNSGSLRLWDTVTGRLRALVLGEHSSLLAFGPDGRTLVTSDESGTVRLRDPATGRARATLAGHKGQVYAAAFGPGGRTLATGSHDGTVRLWDIATGRTRAVLTGFEGMYGQSAALAFGPDGHTLAGVAGNAVRLWDVHLPGPAAALRKICAAVGPDLTAEERTAYLAGLKTGPVCPS
ncbi:WD40 repeat domain-containing protein [Streptomyces chrestomyceticus]|uniref:WD40 repeat domain-containing protein n=1 Tax=Streptomyces chrestomyceticus TaxID=68185 RepID=UPI0027DD260D|nr:hypothetical protein [Streptomyces chrestomyceticus]